MSRLERIHWALWGVREACGWIAIGCLFLAAWAGLPA